MCSNPDTQRENAELESSYSVQLDPRKSSEMIVPEQWLGHLSRASVNYFDYFAICLYYLIANLGEVERFVVNFPSSHILISTNIHSLKILSVFVKEQKTGK